MGNFETVQSITDNLQTVLQDGGIKFQRKAVEETKDLPASAFPLGQIFYEGEEFEQTHGQRPSWSEIDFRLRVILKERSDTDLMREEQKWVHLIRDGVTVNALNIDDLASSKLVSEVTTERVEIEHLAENDGKGVLEYKILVRYREL